eukprot:GHRR01006661.1.p1 GENE.GHRR01006661.1~~GHRR01006661.1.p1  ORF type:complete len:148 (+),score=20.41 GHRR01006661.1:245-688(+)
MDPLIKAKPDDSGYVTVNDTVRLHYELYQPTGVHKGNILVLMGAFATKDHFAVTARFLADNGYKLCLYNHRGVGKSGPPMMERQTSGVLAADALVLIDTIWGSTFSVAGYFCSYGIAFLGKHPSSQCDQCQNSACSWQHHKHKADDS